MLVRVTGLVEDEAIQVAVVVVIEEDRLRGKSGQVKAIFLRAFRESAVAIVDKELVMAVQVMFTLYGADIDIQQAIAVDIRHGRPGAPIRSAGYSCLIRDVLELEIAFVEVKPVAALPVSGKINIGQAVIVDIAYCYSSPIVVIEIIENAESFFFLYFILEPDIRFR